MKWLLRSFLICWIGSMLSGAAANVADWETVAKGFGFGFLISGVIIGFIGCALLVKQRFFPPVKKPGEGI